MEKDIQNYFDQIRGSPPWYRLIPTDMRPGSKRCIIRVLTSRPVTSILWCEESNYPNGLKTILENHSIVINENGHYIVELSINQEKTVAKFGVFHLHQKPKFTGGEGTKDSPYLISNCAQLNSIRANRTLLNACYRLIADLDIQEEMGFLSWIPIGNFSMKEPKIDANIPLEKQDLGYRYNFGFTGELDGNGHTVSGLICCYPNMRYAGLFGSCGDGAYIHNLCIEKSFYYSQDGMVGIVSGRAQNAVIANCKVNADVITSGTGVGGIIGAAYENVICKSCQFSGWMQSEEEKSLTSLGGIIGTVNAEFGPPFVSISNCCVNAEMYGGFDVGGIVGGGRSVRISRCFYSGKISAYRHSAGILSGGYLSVVHKCVCAADLIHCTMYNEHTSSIQIRKHYWAKGQYGAEEDARVLQYSIGRIKNTFFLDGPLVEQNTNYALSTCRLTSSELDAFVVEETTQNGNTIIDECLHDPGFFRQIGWNIDSIWSIGKNHLPELRF